jgi:tRNA A37 threonylcarbamoyladenosine synthetase subunit TsaC/SUA5/YrdC
MTEILHLTESSHRSRAVEALIDGEIMVVAFNGIFVLIGDADDPGVPGKIATAKGRPRAKGVALVCPPEFLGEHIALGDSLLQSVFPLKSIQALYAAVHAVGLILPAARPGAPQHIVQAGTILNVWTEQRPESPLRQLILQLRRHGHRALAGTSANLAGKPTITDPAEVQTVFAGRVPLMLLDAFDRVPLAHRHSASIVDLTRQSPRLVREGSVPADELRRELRDHRLGELVVDPDMRRV